MDPLLFTLLIITIIVLIISLVFLSFIVIGLIKKVLRDQYETIIKSNQEAMKNSSDINMRLISILTEVVTSNPPMEQETVNEYQKNIDSNDKQIIRNILNPEPSKPFDPFSVDIPIPQEESIESLDAVNHASAVYEQEDATIKK